MKKIKLEIKELAPKKATKELIINVLEELKAKLDAMRAEEEEERETEKEPEAILEKDIAYYIHKIAAKWGWTPEKTSSYLEKLSELNFAASVNVALKEIAIDLDMKYKGHISKAPEVWCISMTNGKIYPIHTSAVTNFKNFAAFRTKEDAEFAKYVMRHHFAEMFDE